MNELGVLTSRYDIYQDLMDPVFPPASMGASGLDHGRLAQRYHD